MRATQHPGVTGADPRPRPGAGFDPRRGAGTTAGPGAGTTAARGSTTTAETTRTTTTTGTTENPGTAGTTTTAEAAETTRTTTTAGAAGAAGAAGTVVGEAPGTRITRGTTITGPRDAPLLRDAAPGGAPAPGAEGPLRVGRLPVWPPVVLAPMAGITNAPFRRLCQAYLAAGLAGPAPGTPATAPGTAAGSPGSPDDAGLLGALRAPVTAGTAGARGPGGTARGLFVSEMITARGLVERNDKTLRMARFADDEPVRSIQLYGTDPATIGEAVRILVAEERADHVDLNFGCPVAKVTRKGGGAALPVRRALFAAIVRAATRAAGDVPVTVKMRIGVDEGLRTFLDAGRIAEDEGAAAVALHARTAAQHYSGRADRRAVAELVGVVRTIPVLGNGDIWEAGDALAMMRETGCAGVVVGRGCLGRPWLFRDLALAARGLPVPPPPPVGELREVLRHHARLLAAWLTEPVAVRDVRKHVGWYLHGYPVGGEARRRLTTAPTLAALEAELDRLDPTATAPPEAVAAPRGKSSGPVKVVLPEGWLRRADDPTPPDADDLDAPSGG